MRGKVLLAALVAGVMSSTALAADWYVSATVGKKKNAGTTKEAPLKAIWDAIRKAADGDTIYIAGGRYYGQTSVGWIGMDKGLTLKGGYSDDFATRDITGTPTLLQPKNEQNMTRPNFGTLEIIIKDKTGWNVVIDGLVFDDGQASNFHKVKGKPEGVATGMWLQPPARGDKPLPSRDKCALYFNTDTKPTNKGNITVQNCVFANSSNRGVVIHTYAGEVKVLNNVFVNSRNIAVDVVSKNQKKGNVSYECANNTILFMWRQQAGDPTSSMGYGVRAYANMTCDFHHNIFGLSECVGFDNTKDSSRPGQPNKKEIKLDNNVFFLNKLGDAQATFSPNLKRVKVDQFEDLEDYDGITSIDGNVDLKDPKVFAGKIDQAYLDGFLSATYSESVDYDENSPANLFREAMGLNKRATVTTKVSMYANLYPLEKTYELIGAMKDYGAQPVK